MLDGCGNANRGVKELVVAHGNVVVERGKKKKNGGSVGREVVC